MTQTDKSKEIQIAEFPSLKYAAAGKKKEQWSMRLCFSSWAKRNIWDREKKGGKKSLNLPVAFNWTQIKTV